MAAHHCHHFPCHCRHTHEPAIQRRARLLACASPPALLCPGSHPHFRPRSLNAGQLTTNLPTGAGNIGDKGVPAQVRKDHDVVPEAAVRPSQDGDYHVGRGGAGNAHVAENKTTHPVHHSLADKLKGQILGVFKKKPSS
jgi:hypothetical protein